MSTPSNAGPPGPPPGYPPGPPSGQPPGPPPGFQPAPAPGPGPRPKGKRPAWLLPTIIGVCAFLLGSCIGAIGGGAGDGDTTATEAAPRETVTVTAEAQPAPKPSKPAYYEPTAADYTLQVATTEKQCFGSAGCNITFRIDVAYAGAGTVDPSATYELTYEVTGGENAYINTLTIQGSQVSQDGYQSVSTESDVELTATATSILKQ